MEGKGTECTVTEIACITDFITFMQIIRKL